MELHRGRMIDHVHLRVADLEASKRFYEAVFEVLGLGAAFNADAKHFQIDELWVDKIDGEGQLSHVHLAFQAPDQQTVQRFHAAALKAGGRDNGAPGERKYHPGYYGAFVFDPDGNNIEAVFHGPAKRSAASVVLTFPGP